MSLAYYTIVFYVFKGDLRNILDFLRFVSRETLFSQIKQKDAHKGTSFRKGLDKEMGMSGPDANASCGKYGCRLCRLGCFYHLRLGNPDCVFDKIVIVGLLCFSVDSRKAHGVNRLM